RMRSFVFPGVVDGPAHPCRQVRRTTPACGQAFSERKSPGLSGPVEVTDWMSSVLQPVYSHGETTMSASTNRHGSTQGTTRLGRVGRKPLEINTLLPGGPAECYPDRRPAEPCPRTTVYAPRLLPRTVLTLARPPRLPLAGRAGRGCYAAAPT